jgi:hypothetical protein
MSYDVIEKMPTGHLVLYSSVLQSGSYPETESLSTALLQHLFKRQLRVVFIGFNTESPMLIEILLQKVNKYGAEDGVGYVNLGFLGGTQSETSYAAFASSLRKVCPRDFKGRSIDELPIMKGVDSITNFDLVVHIGNADEPVHQFYTPYKIPVIIGTQGMMGPQSMPFIAAGQLAGMVVGVPGGAEYEFLIGVAGMGLTQSDAISLSHLLVAAFVILGNASYLYSSRSKKEE